MHGEKVLREKHMIVDAPRRTHFICVVLMLRMFKLSLTIQIIAHSRKPLSWTFKNVNNMNDKQGWETVLD